MRGRAALNILLVILAAAPLALAVANFLQSQGNHALRTEVGRRQHQINEAARLVRPNQALVRAIAMAAIKNRDGRLRELLSRNGIMIRDAPASPGANGRGG